MHKNYTFRFSNGKAIIHTSDKEIKDLGIAWILVSLAFTIARMPFKGQIITTIISKEFGIAMLISIVTVGMAFILHEMAHKIVAQKYGYWAEFRSNLNMLVMGVLISLLGVVFIAPGAVMIYGHITKKQNGKISMAGPMTNIILAIILLPIIFIEFQNKIISEIIISGYLINAWLAIFNMLPVWNLDGAKIYSWNKKAFFSMIITASILLSLFFMIQS